MMKAFRRILAGAALAILAVGVASADTIVAYTATLPFNAADITNLSLLLPGWCPGCSGSAADSLMSAAEPAGYGPAGVTAGVTMASLNAPNTIYTLKGYDIRVTSIISGSYTLTNPAGASSNATGSAHLDSDTAVSLGSPLAPALNNSGNQEPTNDLFYISSNPTGYGYDPDPATTPAGVNLAPGTGMTVSFTNVMINADIGCDFYPTSGNGGNAPCGNYNMIPPNSLNPPSSLPAPTVNVATDGLTFFLSSKTTVDAFPGLTTSNSTQVKERITVTYDFTAVDPPGVPEPVTMVLMGGALVGLGLIGKRLKKS